MQELRDLLQAIQSGKRNFTPDGSTEPQIGAFQETAKALVHADKLGYLNGFRFLKESTTGNRWYIDIVVTNGLTYEGEAYLEERSSSREPAPTPSPANSAPVSIADILQVLELAERNELSFSIDRTSAVPLQAARELLGAGHLSGQAAQSVNGPCIISPAITLNGRLFLEKQKKDRSPSASEGTSLRVTFDTNCIINLFDRQSISATSVPELNTLLRHSFSGTVQIAITTRVEVDMLRDSDATRRAQMLRTLEAFPVIGTTGRFDTTPRGSGDVLTNEQADRIRNELTNMIFPGLQVTDKRYPNKSTDIDHLIGHLINKRDIFVTDDRAILNCTEQLRNSPGILVMSPPQCVTYIEGIAARSTPRILPSRDLNPAYHSPAFKGTVSFDYSNNNHRYAIGSGHFLFETRWSKASNTSIHAYTDSDSIAGVALAKGASSIADVVNASAYDFSSRVRTPKLNEVVIWKNFNGLYAATKILAIKDDSRGDDHDELEIQYLILAQGGTNFRSDETDIR